MNSPIEFYTPTFVISFTVYLMINRAQLDRGAMTIRDIERRLNQTYLGDYTIEA